MSPNPLRNIPSVGELLESPSLRSLVERINHSTLASTARVVLDELRQEAQTVASQRTLPDVSELAERIAQRIMENKPPRMRWVVNATGVLFHPQLGRPPLADAAAEAMIAAARGFVEFPQCGDEKNICCRTSVEQLLRDLTSAERAVTFSSIATATAAAMASLCVEDAAGGMPLEGKENLHSGGELIVARGHVIDFGGEYRIAELAEAVGVRLREIGTANCTRSEDYARAIGAQTSAILWVEDGRCETHGYARAAAFAEVVAAAHARKVPLIAHLDGGTLLDGDSIGLAAAASVPATIAAGADLVVFRGDRLLGGPQCGLIAGRRSQLERIERHPLTAACRLDVPATAALIATLQLYRDSQQSKQAIPLLQLLSASAENLKNRAERLAPQLAACDAVESARVIPATASLSGCNLAADELASWRIEIEPAVVPGEKSSGAIPPAERLAAELRKGEPAVAVRTEGERLLIDMRSVIPWQDIEIVAAFEAMNDDEEDQ